MDVRVLGNHSVARIHADDLGAVRAGDPVQHPCPENGLGFGHVVPVQEHRIAAVDVRVGARLAVRPEGFLQCRCRRGRAEPGVAVHVRGADAGLPDHSEGVVLLEEQLSARVEAMAERSALPEQLLAPVHDPTHGRVPVALHQFAVLPDQRAAEAVLVRHALPAGEESLWAQPAVIHQVPGPAPDTHHGAVLDRDIAGTAIAAQDAGRLDPPVHIAFGHPGVERLVNPDRPGLISGVGSPGSPDLGYAVSHGEAS
ncbi:hypothetical protein AHiyo6_32880 [Arthrobacter sp. Hiyo6]|nr:hypothetical protein AHiyo6_32880 [Arthrobacter sp. Hiyo6]